MYIGNDLQIAHPSYKIIDDISSGFNGSQTSFALQVSGATPVPFPISTQQVMISVNGVVQEPDPSGSAGFKLLGSNIVFSSAPANGHAFFGVINAGADYVTAGSEFPDGSATAPSFTFQDDQDTGWYRNASGDVGYTSNGSAILNFDGNGLTIAGGKGLTVDTNTFHVDAANNSVNIGTTTTSGLTPLLHLHKASSSATAYLHITNTDSGVANSDGFVVGFNGSNDALLFNKESTPMRFATAGLERMRIDSSGKVGIGTTSPTGNLSIASGTYQSTTPLSTADDIVISGNQSLGISLITAAVGTSNNTIAFGDTDDTDIGMIRYAHANNSLQFTTNASEQMRIDSSGRLLLGTTTEGQAEADDLTIATAGITGITIRSGTSSNGNIFFSDGTSGADEYRGIISYSHSSNSLNFSTNSSTVLTINSSGNVGIGTTSPTKPSSSNNSTRFMEIASGDGADLVLSNNVSSNIGAGAHIGTLAFKNIDDTDSGAVPHYAGIRCEAANTSGSMDLRFYIGRNNLESDAPNMLLDSSGRLLLGTTTEGDSAADDLTIATSGNTGITIRSGTSGYGSIYFSDATSGNGEFAGYVQYNHGANQLNIGTNETQNLTINSLGNGTFTGTVSDSKGDLRNIPINSRTGAYTLVVGDAGKVVGNTTGGWTIPANVFTTVGQTVTLLNNSGSDQNITASALTYLYNTADGANIKASTIALGARAMATIWFDGGATGYIQSSKITVS